MGICASIPPTTLTKDDSPTATATATTTLIFLPNHDLAFAYTVSQPCFYNFRKLPSQCCVCEIEKEIQDHFHQKFRQEYNYD